MNHSHPKYSTIVAKGMRLNGELLIEEGVYLQGVVIGRVIAGEGAQAFLRIAQDGRVKGDVAVPNVVVEGIVEGNIECEGDLVLHETARVTGDVLYGRLEVAAGARLNGRAERRDPDVQKSRVVETLPRHVA